MVDFPASFSGCWIVTSSANDSYFLTPLFPVSEGEVFVGFPPRTLRGPRTPQKTGDGQPVIPKLYWRHSFYTYMFAVKSTIHVAKYCWWLKSGDHSPVEGKVVEIPLYEVLYIHSRCLGMGFLTSIKSGDHSPVEGKVGSFFLSQSHLVGGFNPFEKYDRQNGFIFPNFRAENSKNIWVATT